MSPVLAFAQMSPRRDTLVRRIDECYAVPVRTPGPSDQPCGAPGYYTLQGCNCCPDGKTACLSTATCSLSGTGTYQCVSNLPVPGPGSGSSASHCPTGLEYCGTGHLCMPMGSNCCDNIGHYCPASLSCGTSGGSLTCLAATQVATAPSQPSTQINTGNGGAATTASSSPTSHVATTASGISINGGTPVPQVTLKSGAATENFSWTWSVGATLGGIFAGLLA
jgi:hypothetical protein